MTRIILFFMAGALVLLADAGMATGQEKAFFRLPVYGNWCGPDHPADMSRAAPPVDMLDAACMRHDVCVAARGDFDCGCDLAFLGELRATPWPNPVIASNARAIHDAIALVPCRSPEGTARKQSLFAADLFNDMISGRSLPVDVVDRWRRLMLGP